AVIHRHDRVERELRVVHAAREDDLAGAVRVFGADPGDIGALAGEDLSRGLLEQGLAIAVFLTTRNRLEDAVERVRLAIGLRKAEWALGEAIMLGESRCHLESPLVVEGPVGWVERSPPMRR